MSQPIKQPSFSGGEISPALYARTDLARYESSARTLRNFITMRHGGATQRPGTQYVATTLNGGNAIRLIPFIFNETGTGQSYVIEFGNQYIAFYQNGAVITSGGNPYTIVSPYLQADLSALKFAQSADILTICHPSYPVYELKRLGATNWTLTLLDDAQFVTGIVNPTSPGLTGTAGSDIFAYCVTAVNANGEESSTASSPYTGAVIGTNSLALPSVSTPVTVTWTASANATSYRIYFSLAVKPGLVVIPLNQWGYVGTVDGTTTTFKDTGRAPDYSQGPPQRGADLYAGAGSYPSAVGYVQQRRVFAASNNNPLGFWMSQPGSFYNFYVSIPSKDSDAVLASISGDEVNAIQHILELKFMLLMTAGAELFVQGNGSGTVTPSAINASTQSQYGCSSLRPLKVGDVCLFNQALGSFIRDFSFDFAIDGYRGNDITVFASHLFEGYQLTDWAFQKIPDSIVWAVRSDGTLLGCTYVREQQILAWHRHDFYNGTVENVCAIPENGAYALYLSIKRVINNSTVRYIERMSSRIWADEINATYLDCFSSFNGTNAGSTTMTLLTPGGGFSTSNTAYQQQITLQSSSSFFNSSMVGNQIVMSDAAFASSIGSQGADGTLAFLGPSGNQIRCTIQAYISATQVTVTPSGIVPTTLQNTAITTWARAVKTVTGLSYLAGQKVSVWADRFVVGSPLNSIIPTVYTVGSDGTLTLDKPYSVIYVGLPMIADLQTLDLENSFGETMMAKRKRTARLNIHLLQTRTLFAGSENPDINNNNTTGDYLFQLYELKRGESQATYDQPPELMTEQDYVLLETRWNKNGRLFIRNVDPAPCTILSVSPQGEDPAQSPFYKRV